MTKKYAEPIPHFIPFTQNVAVTLVFSRFVGAAAEWQLHAKAAGMVKKPGVLDEKISGPDYVGKKMELFEEIVTDAANFYKS